MERKFPLPASSTELVFWTYALVVGSAGLLLAAWGPMWLGVDLPGTPFGKAAMIRLAGGGMLAAACFAAAMAQVTDDDARRRGMLWFSGGHFILWLVVFSQQHAIWNSALVERLLFLLYIPILAFLFFRGEIDLHATTVQTIFGVGERVRAGVSRHDREIREAAGREERNRLARDLHDSIKQQLFAIQTATATAQVRFDSDPAGASVAMAEVRSSTREAMAEMEAMLDQLRAAPLENVGLVEAIKRQAEVTGFRTGADVSFTLGGLPPDRAMPRGAQLALFRVAQEALSNVARHARASEVRVTLAVDEGSLKLTVKDNGAGFDPASPSSGMGIGNMRERAAEFGGLFELTSKPAGGTCLSFAIPFTLPATEAEYAKKIRTEMLFLLLLVVLSIALRSGVLGGFLVAWSFRVVRAVLAWVDFRAAREVVLVIPLRIALVDDHRVVARSLQSYLESFPDMQVVGIAAGGEELLAHLAEWKPEIVIQDLLLPGGIDGIETTRRVRERAPSVRVIALTASMDEARMTGVLRAGAAGYVRKDADPEILLAAVRAVARGGIFIDPSVSGRFSPVADELTRRELEVLRLLVDGLSNKEIAGALEIGDETVKTHVTNVLGKLHADNRAQAVAQALKRGLVD